MNLYDVGRGPVNLFLKVFYRIEFIGKENFNAIDPNKGILLCSNHVSNLDPPAVAAGCPRELSFMAKAELFKIPGFKQLITKLNAFPINRGAGDRHALKQAINIVNKGGTLIMFPEGKRIKDGKLGSGQPGAGFLTLKSDAEIVPVAIIGRYKLFGKTKIVYGKPIDFSEARIGKKKAMEVTNIIMDHIQELMDKYS